MSAIYPVFRRPILVVLFLFFSSLGFSTDGDSARLAKEVKITDQLLSKPVSEDSAVLNHVRQALSIKYLDPKNGFDVYTYLAGFCESQNARELSLAYYVEALNYQEKLSPKNSEQGARICKKLADGYNKTGKYDAAIRYLEKSLSWFPADTDSVKTFFQLGELEFKRGDLKRSAYYLEKTKTRKGQAQDVLALKGLILLKDSNVTVTKVQAIANQLKGKTKRAQEFYLEYASWLLSENYVLLAGEMLAKADGDSIPVQFRRELLTLKAKRFKSLMEPKEAKQMEDSIKLLDSIPAELPTTITGTDSKWSKLFAQPAIFPESPKESPYLLSAKSLKIMLYAVLAILIVLALVLLIRKLLFSEKEPQLAVASVGNGMEQLHYSVSDEQLIFQEKEKILERLHDIQRISSSEEAAEALNKLTIELEGDVNQDRSRPKMLENIDHLFTRFYGSIEQEKPELTIQQRELMGLIRLNLSLSEIADLWNVSEVSVHQHIKDLKTKLRLTEEEDIYIFIANL